MHPKELNIDDYSYDLPEDKIARYPLAERDASRLLIYKDEGLTEDVYRNLPDHLSPGSLIVFNRTRVVQARLLFQKPTGGTIEVFCLEPHSQYPDVQTAMGQTGSVLWNCMIGGASKWKQGQLLEQSDLASGLTLTASVAARASGSFTLQLSWDNKELSFAQVLELFGEVPLPPYLQRRAETQDKDRYQTIYAAEEGSVAAPTAGLHFTPRLLSRIKEKDLDTAFVTLHVGAGTFKPVKAGKIAQHEMHAEWLEVSVDAINEIRNHLAQGIIAVGTTSLRTLESLYWIGVRLLNHQIPDLTGIAVGQWDPYELSDTRVEPQQALQAVADWMLQNGQERLITKTQILIAPGYSFRIVRGLITNFHQPQSTLLLLVAAFVGPRWKRIYEYALDHDFRFLSYGDGSLLWADKEHRKLP